jgi:putative flavoprotein involved in K+ transport
VDERVEVVVIGAGQAGLAASRRLTEQGREHLVLERAGQVGGRWRTERWDSLTLVSPNWSLRLPGFDYAGDDPDGYLGKDGVVRYLEDYAASFRPPVRYDTEVDSVAGHPSGRGFLVTTAAGRISADNVIVATGPYHLPTLPPAAAALPADVRQLHAAHYRNPEQLPPGAVLVVGTGQSGAQIAEELYRAGREVHLSVGGSGRAPRRYRGRDIIWWLLQVGFFDQTFAEAPEPKTREGGIPHLSGRDGGHTLDLHRFARDGVHLLGRIRGADGGTLRLAGDLHENLAAADGFAAFATDVIDHFVAETGLDAPPAGGEPVLRDGFATPLVDELDLAAAGITSVVWATGYRYDWSPIHFAVFDQQGYPLQRQGVTDVPGLYFLGLQWMHTRKSATFWGVGEDAAHVTAHIGARRLASAR